MKFGYKFIFLIFSLILITPFASSYTFINIYIDETGKVIFSGETEDQIDLPLGIELKNAIISGETQELTNKQGIIWTFSYELKDSEFYVVLPAGSAIHNISNGEIYIEDEQFSIYAKDSITIEYSLGEIDKIDFTLCILIFLIIILILVFFVKRKKKKPKTKENKLEIIKQVLNEREKLILDKLKETGKIKGSYLRRACEIPKPSFYRHVLELEKKGLIKRSGDGRNKFIELIKKD
ncbi:MAG: hypothetical protein JSW73_00190 [Candidatus Woesearchaeota archaeon]|nr:MAG: hypothetical protein JSW73_00190 [Candidatus Woesearchaeota archaeon]